MAARQLSISPAIVPSILDRAKELFLSRHMYASSSNLKCLAPFRPPAPCDAYLIFSAKAAMLACFFNEVKCQSVLQRARKSYSTALDLVNKALRLPDVVTRNVTIATVLLLDHFEKFTGTEDYDKAPTTIHLQGALALFRLRDGDQFADPITMSMFRYLSLDVLVNSLKHGTQIPGDFLYLRNQASHHIYANDYEWQFMDFSIRLVHLREGLKEGSVSTNEASAALKEMDDEYFRMVLNNSGTLLHDMSKHGPSTPDARAAIATEHVTHVRLLLDELLQ
ncbi:hypothetical protein BP6252_13633 [Coleophoma cylindrospora]|uniref:Transcription factor domain-containing protein n=1 Tax=Coleophoma cylindrospora TaxID=1849047 RepID=A0A3D8Q8R2_9HELO|nr:hypothetical protein BP6252_13633 [Coleophoma cylindrospora]